MKQFETMVACSFKIPLSLCCVRQFCLFKRSVSCFYCILLCDGCVKRDILECSLADVNPMDRNAWRADVYARCLLHTCVRECRSSEIQWNSPITGYLRCIKIRSLEGGNVGEFCCHHVSGHWTLVAWHHACDARLDIFLCTSQFLR